MNILKNFNLRQRLFIVQSFYQNKCEVSYVKHDFETAYGIPGCQEDVIWNIIRLFQETGGVLQNNECSKCLQIGENFEENQSVDSEMKSESPLPCTEDTKHVEIKQEIVVFGTDQNNDTKNILGNVEVPANDPLESIPTDKIPKEHLKTFCDVCKKKFINYKDYHHHVQTHHDKKCPVCGKNIKNLDSHLKKCHEEKPTEKPLCPICGKYYSCLKTLKEHMAIHSDVRQFKCVHCSKSFNSRSSWRRHTHTHNKSSRDYICEICSRSFYLRYHLTKHQKIHNRPITMSVSCDICGEKFNQKSELRSHMPVHAEERHFVCEICQKRFTHRYKLMRHMMRHKNLMIPYKCDICPKKFFYESDLNSHFERHKRENKVKMEAMEKIRANEVRMDEQTMVQSNANYENIEQNLQIDVSINQEADISMELKELPKKTKELVKCDICEKSFRNNYALKEHRTVHTGEKRYKCNVCQKAFRQQSGLINHSVIHTGEKKFECHLCDKAFTQRDSLRIHQRVHTGEKSEICKVCNKALASKITLRKHMETFHLTTDGGRHDNEDDDDDNEDDEDEEEHYDDNDNDEVSSDSN